MSVKLPVHAFRAVTRDTVAIACVLAPAMLNAQNESPGAVLEEIVVTAGFRENNVMSAAGSVTVVNESIISERSAQHLESVLNTSANVNYSGGGSRARFIQVRGVGDLEQFVDPKHFPSVGIALDDINLGGAANAAMLFDVNQVEILRGPQGTRFGGSALAGMVNIRSNRPTDILESSVEMGAGNYGRWSLGGVISGPLSERVSGRLAIQKNESDGYIDNVFLGRDDTNGFDETSIRVSFDFDPNDTSFYSLTAFRYDGRNGYDAFSLDNTRDTLSDEPGHDHQDTTALAGKAQWQLSETASVEAIATWLDSDGRYGFDEDWTFAGICDGTLCDPVFDFFSNTDDYFRSRDEISMDVRLLGTLPDTTTDYVIGAYSQERDEDLRRQYYGDFSSRYTAERRALYGQIETRLAGRVSLTAGLRYEQFDDSYSDSFAAQTASDDTLKSGELTFAFQASDNTMMYATLSRGNKAGGVNTDASANLPFMQPFFQDFMRPRLKINTETLVNRELGLKGSYLDGQLSLRAALFYMDRDNAQLESWMWDGVNFLWIGFLDNVDGTNAGAELEINYRHTDRIGFFGSIGVLQTDVNSITTFDLDRNEFVVRAGIDQAKSPAWQFNLGTNLTFNSNLTARLELEGRDDSQFGYYHSAKIDGYTMMNASLRYRRGQTEFQLWSRNLTNKDYAVHGLYFGNDPRKGWINETYYQYGEPRAYGISAKHSF
ncbi:MAG: iron complex outermembrane receptor protein [Pirellulaceae bacterium]|jgi:iron complex outermembrane receptor protein